MVRAEPTRVCGLVPGEDLPAPAKALVAAGQGLAEGEHAIVILEGKRGDRARIGDAPVVGIVKQEGEIGGPAQMTEMGDDGRVGPFMDEDEVGTLKRRFVVAIAGVGPDGEAGEVVAEALDRLGAGIGQEVGPAPTLFGLKSKGLVATGLEFAQDAAKKMGVAVVPVRDQRMGVEHDPHLRPSTRGSARRRQGRQRAAVPG